MSGSVLLILKHLLEHRLSVLIYLSVVDGLRHRRRFVKELRRLVRFLRGFDGGGCRCWISASLFVDEVDDVPEVLHVFVAYREAELYALGFQIFDAHVKHVADEFIL